MSTTWQGDVSGQDGGNDGDGRGGMGAKSWGGCREGWNCPPPPSSCSADGHSPGKQASEHSLLSSAFTCAMPMSLLLSHLRPRKAPVLGPGRELRQLKPRPRWGSTLPF